MKGLTFVLMLGLTFGLCLSALAVEELTGAYEHQLMEYPTIFESTLEELANENIEHIERYEALKIKAAQLVEQYGILRQSVRIKEDSIDSLKDVNAKLNTSYMALQNQYEELEELFLAQKETTNKLRDEIDAAKVLFYQRMVEFFEEESNMIDGLLQEEDDLRAEKIDMLKERQQEVQGHILKMKEMIVTEPASN